MLSFSKLISKIDFQALIDSFVVLTAFCSCFLSVVFGNILFFILSMLSCLLVAARLNGVQLNTYDESNKSHVMLSRLTTYTCSIAIVACAIVTLLTFSFLPFVLGIALLAFLYLDS